MAERVVEQFPEVARVAADLIHHPSVAARWTDESACAGMTVGGLANHLAGQAANVVLLLAQEPRDEQPISVLEHYRRAAWVHTGLDGEANVAVRTSADEYAASGPADLAERVSPTSPPCPPPSRRCSRASAAPTPCSSPGRAGHCRVPTSC